MTMQQSKRGLQFNVSQLLKEPTGATRYYSIETEPFRHIDDDTTITAPLTGEIRLLRTGRDILVTGELQTEAEKECGRCLTRFVTPISAELEETFYPLIDVISGNPLPLPEDADEANQIDSQHILDLNEVVRQSLLIEADSILYCSPDCKGICASCGKNLNEGPCDCSEEITDIRWAGLKALQAEFEDD